MSFRQAKSNGDIEGRTWRAWLSHYERALKEIGLPPSVTLSEEYWVDCLQNGYLERHTESRDSFEFGQLSTEQMSGLLALLEASPRYLSESMVDWLRNRLRSITGARRT